MSILLSSEERSILIGIVLGDGYLYKNGRLQVEQSQKQVEYVRWLHQKLNRFAGKLSENVPKNGIKSITFSARFYTLASFNKIHGRWLESLFYPKDRQKYAKEKKTSTVKIIPENLAQLLDPISLAVWFMDDGTNALNTPTGAAYFNISAFNEKERLIIQNAFSTVFNINTTIQKAGNQTQFNLYIGVDSYRRFYNLVDPTMVQVPSMMYKLTKIDSV